MKIDSTLTTIKNIHRRVVGYSAHYHSLGTAREHQSKPSQSMRLGAGLGLVHAVHHSQDGSF